VEGTDRCLGGRSAVISKEPAHLYCAVGLNEIAFYDPINFTYPAGAYIAEVEIDRDTSTVELVNFTGADDFGRGKNTIWVRSVAEAHFFDAFLINCNVVEITNLQALKGGK
jgi:carbon-monoxide dehydrogenase large subunit